MLCIFVVTYSVYTIADKLCVSNLINSLQQMHMVASVFFCVTHLHKLFSTMNSETNTEALGRPQTHTQKVFRAPAIPFHTPHSHQHTKPKQKRSTTSVSVWHFHETTSRKCFELPNTGDDSVYNLWLSCRRRLQRYRWLTGCSSCCLPNLQVWSASHTHLFFSIQAD
jgi:hypothetical protein